MKIKVAEYIADFLERNRINNCFMVTGGGAMHLNDALGHNNKIHCIFNHHEQASAIAAEGYARMTGKIAIVCVTSGPGGTNAITGVVGGWLDSIPMLIISGQAKRETTTWVCKELNLRQLGDQEFDIISTVSNMTKYATMVMSPIEISYHLEKALYLATNGRPGPVWLDIPLDVQSSIIDTNNLIHFNNKNEFPWMLPSVRSETAEFVLKKIEQSKSPLFLVGAGVRLSGAEEEMLKLLDKIQIPVVTAWNSNDLVAYDNPYFVGMPGTVGTRAGNFAVQNCDVLISIGCRLNIRTIGYNHFDFAKQAFKIIVDIDPRELNKPTIRPDIPINADSKDFINALLRVNYSLVEKHKEWLKWCRSLLKKYPVVLDVYGKNESLSINPYVFIDKLFHHFKDDERIVCGNGSACVITFQACQIKQGQRMFTNSGCAAMGYGFPAAIGVSVSDNTKRTICIDGDGSIMMNIQELATVAKNKLNIIIFLINNNGYHSIRQTQSNLFDPPYVGIDSNSGLSFPDFCKLAESFGIEYFLLKEEAFCDKTIDEALNCNGPCICEVIVDPGQFFAPKLSSKVLPNGKIVSPTLDDMFPFLDPAEYKTNSFNG